MQRVAGDVERFGGLLREAGGLGGPGDVGVEAGGGLQAVLQGAAGGIGLQGVDGMQR
ncbi:hypothetical protein [Noviherbaspirillum aerium]|uniref:hypothetical protein n=1 Tax=Noviherbaspirillum aerium TaxID=2588497 RepID=UPI00178C434C|nr:hypothetical protein [Noviherbaspirillum aerium]